MALNTLPPEFREKYDQLLSIKDSRTGKPVTDILGVPKGELKKNTTTGGGRVEFHGGSMFQFDHTGRYPIFVIWGKIEQLYYKTGSYDGAFGRPLTDVVDLSDGGRCAQFEGGHIHEYGTRADPFPAEQCVASFKPPPPPHMFGTGPAGLPTLFHQKWMQLSVTQHLTAGISMAEFLQFPYNRMSENRNGGQSYNFYGGNLVSIDSNTLPVVIYGSFKGTWDNVGGSYGGLGHPLTDPQAVDDGSFCQVFAGGHIHQRGNETHVTSGLGCRAPYQPKSRAATWNDWPPHFQRKWGALCDVVDPLSRNQVVELIQFVHGGLRDNAADVGGQVLNFYAGEMVSLSKDPPTSAYYTPPVQYGNYAGVGPAANSPASGYPPPQSFPGGFHPQPGSPGSPPPPPNSGYFTNGPQHAPGFAYRADQLPLALQEPFLVYGPIYRFWKNAGGVSSTYGRPLCDEQDLPDGGRCSIFEGNHIHSYNGNAAGVPANQCTAAFQPPPPPRKIASQQPAAKPPMSPTAPPPVTKPPQEEETGCAACCRKYGAPCGCNIVYRNGGRSGDCRCGECVWATFSSR